MRNSFFYQNTDWYFLIFHLINKYSWSKSKKKIKFSFFQNFKIFAKKFKTKKVENINSYSDRRPSVRLSTIKIGGWVAFWVPPPNSCFLSKTRFLCVKSKIVDNHHSFIVFYPCTKFQRCRLINEFVDPLKLQRESHFIQPNSKQDEHSRISYVLR